MRIDGYKELLGLWLSENEGAKFWLSCLTDLKNRLKAEFPLTSLVLIMLDDGYTKANTSSSDVPPKLHGAIEVLLEAYLYSRDVGHDRWDFAIEFRELELSKNDWRWLICKNLVQHRHDRQRDLSGRDDLSIRKKSSFVLTELGARVAVQIPAASSFTNERIAPATCTTIGQSRENDLPEFLSDVRELRFRSHLVKRFKLPSPNQETILLAFQEQEWECRIDDPLPPVDEQCSKRRLLDTIKSLNRHQQHQLLNFRGDGTGEGVCWRPLSD